MVLLLIYIQKLQQMGIGFLQIQKSLIAGKVAE